MMLACILLFRNWNVLFGGINCEGHDHFDQVKKYCLLANQIKKNRTSQILNV